VQASVAVLTLVVQASVAVLTLVVQAFRPAVI